MMMNLEEIPISRFNPTDEEIIRYYLRPKVEGEDMTRFSPFISEQDLYNELPPWVIFQDGDGEDHHMGRFFYTRLKKKHDSGEKIHRTVGKNGEYCWDAQDNGTNIRDHRTMTVIGKRKQYSLIRSNQKKDGGANEKRKQISSSKDDDEHNEVDESFGHWIMHEYSLVNHPSSMSSKNNQNYVLCRTMMKAPPKPTSTITTTTGNASIHDHATPAPSTGNAAIHDHATPAPSSANDYQNMSYPQEQDCLSMLLYDQEQPAPMEEWLAPPPVVSEWEGYGLNDIGGDGTSSSYNDQHKILDDDDINHDRILLVDLTKNMEPLPPIILPKSMVHQEQYYPKNKDISPLLSNMSTRMQEEERRVMINIGEGIKGDAIVDPSFVPRSIAQKKIVGKSNPKSKLL